MNNSLEDCSRESRDSMDSELAERLLSAISLPVLPESKSNAALTGARAEDKATLPVADVQIGDSSIYFCSTPSKEPADEKITPAKDSSASKDSAAKDTTPVKDSAEKSADQKIKDAFGSDVFDHLNDWDWLIENRKKLTAGFKKIDGQDAKWEAALRMQELSKVDGKPLIYLNKVDSNSRGNLIPKRYDIMLLRGRFRSDDYIDHLHH